MESFLTHFGYWGIFLVLMASGVGLPLPEDIPLIFGGYLCAQNPDGVSIASLEVMIPFTFFTVLGADTLLYLIGRKYGRHVPNLPLFRRFLTPQRLAAAEMAFHSHGGKTLFTSRFVPGVRAAVFFTAGVFKIPAWKFLLFDGAAALISVPLLVLAGYFFADHIDQVRHAAFTTQILVLGALVAGLGVFFYIKRRRNKARFAKLDSSSKPDSPAVAPSSQPPAKMVRPLKVTPSKAHP